HGDAVACGLHVVGQDAADGVVLQQVRHDFGVAERVVDRHQLDAGVGVGEDGAEEAAADAPEAVDADAHAHGFLLFAGFYPLRVYKPRTGGSSGTAAGGPKLASRSPMKEELMRRTIPILLLLLAAGCSHTQVTGSAQNQATPAPAAASVAPAQAVPAAAQDLTKVDQDMADVDSQLASFD